MTDDLRRLLARRNELPQDAQHLVDCLVELEQSMNQYVGTHSVADDMRVRRQIDQTVQAIDRLLVS